MTSGWPSVSTSSAAPPAETTKSRTHSAARRTSSACAGSALTLGMAISSASSSTTVSCTRASLDGRCWYNGVVATFLVTLLRSGPQWDADRPLEDQSDWPAHAAFMDGLVDTGLIVLGGPLADEHRVVHVVEASSEEDVRATFARDPWSETHLRVGSIEPWTLRLDARR